MRRTTRRARRGGDSRVELLFTGIAILLLGAFPEERPVDPATAQRLNHLLAAKERAFRGTFAVAFKDLDNGQTFLYRAHEMMHAASLMKVPVMIEVFRQAEEGRFLLQDSLVVRNRFHSIVDASPYALRVADESDDFVYTQLGRKMAIRDLVQQMITVSSNLATNLLLELVGPDRVTAGMRALGAARIQVRRGLEDQKAFQQGINNETDAYDMLLILEAIAKGKAASPGACAQMIEIMCQQKLNTKIPALLPDSIRVAHKTGSISGIDHDAGILYFPSGRSCVLVVLSKGIADHQRAASGIAEITRDILRQMQLI
ncbi:MAG: serine hydrolase [Candidatus Oleimicrobiaceae bacterium]